MAFVIRLKQSTNTDIPLSLQPGEPAVRLWPDRVDLFVGDSGGVPRQVSGGAGGGEGGGWNGEPLSQPLIITGATDPNRISLRGTTADGRAQIDMRDANGTTGTSARMRNIPGTGIEFDVGNTLAARLVASGAAGDADTIMTRARADARFLALSGGTVNGGLTLLNTGTGTDNPATRGHVASVVANLLSSTAAAAAFVAKSGDTMAGPLTLSGDPTAAGHAARKAYVDAGLATRVTKTEADTAYAAKSHTHTEAQISDLNRLRWRGADLNTSWLKDDVVAAAGTLYVARSATSQPPPGATWDILTTGGASAYDIWLAQGYEGTEEDFLNWLAAGGGPPEALITDMTYTRLSNTSAEVTVTVNRGGTFYWQHLTDGSDYLPEAIASGEVPDTGGTNPAAGSFAMLGEGTYTFVAEWSMAWESYIHATLLGDASQYSPVFIAGPIYAEDYAENATLTTYEGVAASFDLQTVAEPDIEIASISNDIAGALSYEGTVFTAASDALPGTYTVDIDIQMVGIPSSAMVVTLTVEIIAVPIAITEVEAGTYDAYGNDAIGWYFDLNEDGIPDVDFVGDELTTLETTPDVVYPGSLAWTTGDGSVDGDVVTVEAPTWAYYKDKTGFTSSYVLTADGVEIAGTLNTPTYTRVTGDAGKILRVVGTATFDGGTPATSTSPGITVPGGAAPVEWSISGSSVQSAPAASDAPTVSGSQVTG